jgi:pimeloyl-ACP methyl ester carboxylesterase/predicted glycosyltransferase
MHHRNDRRVLASIAPGTVVGPGSAAQEFSDRQIIVPLGFAPRAQTQARYPDAEGQVERDGQRIFYEVYGDADETVFLLPTWSLVHSRHWKMQIPYLARHFRVLAMDGLGNGRSDRCREPGRYGAAEFARDCLAVMDATGTGSAVMVALSRGTQYLLELGRLAPERVAGAAFVGPMFPYTLSHWTLLLHPRVRSRFGRPLPRYLWWGRMNGVYWRECYPDFAHWFISRCFSERHSTKGIEDGVGWALDSDAATLAATALGEIHRGRPALRTLARDLDCPVLVIHGNHDRITPFRDGRALARLTGGSLEMVVDGGHFVHARKPVQVNLALREFAESAFGRPRFPRRPAPSGRHRPRALYISSPIGLGHARRDVAIARELRRLHPELEIDWLAQHPVTCVLEAEGERIHPASAHLASESRHIESESAEHDLHCFQALRRMDEILAANFMLFHDVAAERRYDLWIGDEAWELDYYLHENPRQKQAPFVWLTDFVGFLPMRDGGERERLLTTDYNAEMIEHIQQHPEVRDRAIFVGEPDDIVPGRFGPGLPAIREWTEEHFSFPGYITGFDPAAFADRDGLRAELGYGPEERVCLVTVGGSGVGASLLGRVAASFREAKRIVPRLRMIMVTGPRIDPNSLPARDGLEVRSYVHDLYKHLAACDLAIVQGGLTTAMELTAYRRPFIYFPLKHHFEQNFHVRHRLERYRAGRRMGFDDSPPEAIAEAIAHEVGRSVDYQPVATDGAVHAAALIAELLE